MKSLNIIIFIVITTGCVSSAELSVEDQIKNLPDPFERLLDKRSDYLSDVDYLPNNTPYDDQPALQKIYLEDYREAFLKETHPETMQIRLVHPILDSDESRAAHYGWHAGANAGWDQFGIWLKESGAEWDRDVRKIAESN